MPPIHTRRAISACCWAALCAITSTASLHTLAQTTASDTDTSTTVVTHIDKTAKSTLHSNLDSLRKNNDTQLSLSLAIQLTLANNPGLMAFPLKQQQARISQAQAALKPAYEISLEAENLAGDNAFSGINQAEITLALSSVLELGGKRQARLLLSQANTSAVELQQRVATLDTLAQLTQEFIAALASQATLALAKEREDLMQALVTDSRNRAQRGALSPLEVLRAEAARAQAQLARQSWQAQLHQQTQALGRFWGESQFAVSQLLGELFQSPNELNINALLLQLDSAPVNQLMASQERIQTAQWQLSKTQERADLSWQLGLRHLQGEEATAAVVALSMPLASRPRGQLATAKSRGQRELLMLSQDQQRLQLRLQLTTAHQQRQQFSSALKRLQNDVIPRLQQALDIAINDYQRGRLRFQDRLTVQDEWLQAKQQRIDTAAALLINQSILEQLTGQALSPKP
ncbi:TolC family protein [Halioxenophilus aromaticivorans]|uniref:TolC family protein n=1 Tax=Halioxenophilus aromaticivorans TaxID=1306992 RepID=A0AAV3TZZ8_9ALTE